MAYYSGKREPLILRREDGREDEFPLQALFWGYHEWFEWEKKALEHVEGRVLDVGCGAGRHSLWLQEKGFDVVVGIDVSPLAGRVARARGLANVAVMAAQELGFAPSSFDTILLLGNNFGICGTMARTQFMMEQLHQMTSKNGILIATSRDVTKTSKPQHIAYQELNRKRRRPTGQVTLRVECGEDVGEWFDLLMVTPAEMEEMCTPIGWSMERTYESENGLYAAILRAC